ncbi:MAG: ATP-binding protein [Magnetococcus sp. YQC-9]
MRIRTKLIWLALLPLLVFLLLSGHAMQVQREVEMAYDQSVQSDQLSNIASELTVLTYELLTNNGERPQHLWMERWRQISAIHTQLRPLSHLPDEFYLLDELENLLSKAKQLFEEHQRAGSTPARGNYREMIGQKLLIEIKSLPPLAKRFNELNHLFIRNLLHRQGVLNLILMSLLVLVVSPIALTMSRSIAASLTVLRNGILTIFSGEGLSHPIRLPSRDELAEVAEHINQMTLRLHETTVSRDELQHEIQERIAIEKQLAETMLFNEQIIEKSSVGILVYQQEGPCILANEAAGRIVGATTGQLLQQNFHQIASWRENGLYATALEALEHNATRQTELFIRSSFGVEAWINCHLTPLHLHSQHHLLLLFTDVSAYHHAQQLMSLAKATAEEANRAKSNFLANMSHEIRTPLNIVIGMSSILIDTPLHDDQRHYVTMLNTAGNNLLALINDILDLSKIEANKLVIQAEPIQLRKEAQEVIDLLQVMATHKGVDLDLVIDPTLPTWILSDGLRLRQCLYNLVSNALKFTTQGGVKVEMMRIPAPHQPMLRCIITDSGIGIPPDHLEKIFEDFTQADPSITKRYGGTGLGLSLTRHLVEIMGGRIQVESHSGSGSRFEVSLPLHATQAPERTEPPRDQIVASLQEMAPMNLLVVDDVEENRLLVKIYLEKFHHRLIMACNGADALRLIQTQPIDIILMDIEMPVMNGIQATQAIRQWEQESRHDRHSIIAFSANALTEDIQKSLKAGCDDHMSKPIQKWSLLAKLEQHAQRRGCQAMSSTSIFLNCDRS